MMKFLLLLCAILYQSQAEEMELKACIRGHDVYLIMDVHTNDTNAIQQVFGMLEDLSHLIEPYNTWFSILGFPRSNSGSLRWKKANQLQGAKHHVSRSFDDPSVHPDMNEALKDVKDSIYGSHTMRSNNEKSVIILTHTRPRQPPTSEEEEEEEEEEDEEKGLDSPTGKERMAEIAEDIQALAMVYVVAIGPFEKYELSDVASCKTTKCLERHDSFNGLQGLTERFLTPDC